MARSVQRRAFSDEAIESLLIFQPPQALAALDLSDRPGFQVQVTGIRAATEYEVLLGQEATP